MEDDKKDKPKIPQVENGKSINDLIDETNELYDKFMDEFKKPLDNKKTEVMKICLFTKTKGAGLKQCYLGSMLAMAASIPDITVDTLKKQITVIDKEPYLKIKVVDKWEPTFEALESWVTLYVELSKKCGDLMKEAEDLPPKAVDVVKNASEEYEDLDLMAKAKMGKANLTASNNIKKAVKEMLGDLKGIADEILSFKDMIE